MNTTLYGLMGILSGAALAGALVVAARRWALNELRVYAVGLLVAALVYGVAAALRQPSMLPVEWLGVALFGAFAFVSLHRSTVLAAGWALHVAWDLSFPSHHSGALVPYWYPWLCVGFDLSLAVYILRSRPV